MIRYKKVGYCALNVSDLQKSSDFYERLVGLEKVESDDPNTAFFRCSRDHHNLVLTQDQEPGLNRIGLELETPELVEQTYEKFMKLGLNPVEVSKKELDILNQFTSFRVVDPFGITFEFYSDMIQVPYEFKPTVADIQKLGHVVLKTPNVEDSVKFYTEVFNFQVSDYVGGTGSSKKGGAFFRCFPVSYHHSFAVFESEEASLHHVNFMVSSIDDIGKGVNRFENNGVDVVFGPGRHAPSGAIFLYVLDPDGLTIEYSFGMEEFPEENPRKPKFLQPVPGIMDLWGGAADPRMASLGKIKGLVRETIKA
ncbi:MAG TPA: 2,3-dihydroxy-p-cumate-3,4-dioxygenase [Bacillales bacterium]|nr:2,3-dihydroxy-p-cumate-3,4-dioxygenase [Bacillales bacterium]